MVSVGNKKQQLLVSISVIQNNHVTELNTKLYTEGPTHLSFGDNIQSE
jgi:hypothetical protein